MLFTQYNGNQNYVILKMLMFFIGFSVGFHVGKGGEYVMPWDFDVDPKVQTRKHIHSVSGKHSCIKEVSYKQILNVNLNQI